MKTGAFGSTVEIVGGVLPGIWVDGATVGGVITGSSGAGGGLGGVGMVDGTVGGCKYERS